MIFSNHVFPRKPCRFPGLYTLLYFQTVVEFRVAICLYFAFLKINDSFLKAGFGFPGLTIVLTTTENLLNVQNSDPFPCAHYLFHHYYRHKKTSKGAIPLEVLVRPTGFEPAAYRVGVCHSIQLSYERKYL